MARCETLFAEHHSAVYRLCLSRLRNPEDAEDATQETFARAVGLGANVGEGWLITVARNVCIDNLRRRSHGLSVLSTGHDPEVCAAVRQAAPEADVVGRAAISQLLEQLTTAERKVVAATILEDQSHVETARALGIASGTSRALLSRATRKMRTYLSEHPEMLGAQVALPVAKWVREAWAQARSVASLAVGSSMALALPAVMAVVVAAGPSWVTGSTPASVATNTSVVVSHGAAAKPAGRAGQAGSGVANPDGTQQASGLGGQPSSGALLLLNQPAPVIGAIPAGGVPAAAPAVLVPGGTAPGAQALPKAPALPRIPAPPAR